jgi:Trk-type K+ transport system membrane component
VTNKEAFVIVALAWLLATIFGSLPFMYVFSMPALRLAFVGYLTLFAPMLPVSS